MVLLIYSALIGSCSEWLEVAPDRELSGLECYEEGVGEAEACLGDRS